MNDLPLKDYQNPYSSSLSINNPTKESTQPLLTNDYQPLNTPIPDDPTSLAAHRQIDLNESEPILQEIQYTKDPIILKKNQEKLSKKSKEKPYANPKGSSIIETAFENKWYDVYNVWTGVLLAVTVGSIIPMAYYWANGHVAVLVLGVIGAGILATGLVYELLAFRNKSLKQARSAVWWMIGFMVYFTVVAIGMMFSESKEHQDYVVAIFGFIIFFVTFVLLGAVRVRNRLDKIFEALDFKYSNFGRA